ncbi:MAG TPA: hypothetical protein DCK83_09215, partial [Gallionellaceae bacterium]|nr:hypothetical protein [Gallionellaceae bacterium]
AGILFLMIAVLGKIEGKIEPGRIGRIGAAILGAVLIVIGLVMQYGETPEMYSKLPPNLIATIQPNTVAVVPASAAVPVIPIKVVSGTYGRNCNAKAGNATAQLAKTCDGQGSCDFVIDPATLEDPAPTCSKDFAAEWRCGDGNAVYSAALSALSGKNDKLRLSCAG